MPPTRTHSRSRSRRRPRTTYNIYNITTRNPREREFLGFGNFEPVAVQVIMPVILLSVHIGETGVHTTTEAQTGAQTEAGARSSYPEATVVDDEDEADEAPSRPARTEAARTEAPDRPKSSTDATTQTIPTEERTDQSNQTEEVEESGMVWEHTCTRVLKEPGESA